MRKVKLLGLAALALFAFGAFTATSALATEDPPNKPEILVLEGTPTELKGTLTAKSSEAPIELIQLSGVNSIKATEAKLLIEGNCEALKESEKDTNLCKLVALHFTGVKQGEVACRSENAKGEKDPVETVLTLLDLHVGAELSTTSVLQPVIFALVLGTADEEEVKFNCGTIKIQVKGVTTEGKEKGGVVECLLGPGLVNIPTTTNVEVLCKVNATSHDPELGKECNVLCLDFGVLGLQADLNGSTFNDAWELIHLLGTLNKDIFIDD